MLLEPGLTGWSTPNPRQLRATTLSVTESPVECFPREDRFLVPPSDPRLLSKARSEHVSARRPMRHERGRSVDYFSVVSAIWAAKARM
jgi:hypothetical protein